MQLIIPNRIRGTLRILRIWRIVFTLLFLLWWDSKRWSYLKGFTQENKTFRQKLRAKWLTRKILQLGSAFIKLGQLISARPDLLPAGWIDELSDLQDNVPSFDFKKVQGILRKEIGTIAMKGIKLESTPLGSASIAQVHRGIILNGKKVVFKIQRPGLKNLFHLDLNVMEKVAILIAKNPYWNKGRDWVGIAKECKKILLRELDFRIEAQYAARFRQQFFDDSKIQVPQVIWKFSSKQVLCLEYIPGIKVTDIKLLEEAGINRSLIAEIGARSYFKQLVEFGFFHADPHPGNLAISREGALIYYDFGMMGMISTRLRERIGTMIKYAALRDTNGLINELQAAGIIAPGIDLGPIRRFIRIVLKEALTPPFPKDFISKISDDLYELIYGKPFRIPVELIFVFRALSTFEGIGRSLDPDFNLISIAKPYLLPLMTSSNSNPNELINQIGKQVSEIGAKAVTLPKRLDESLERLEQGDLQLQIRMGESDRQLRRMIQAQQAMGQSILLGCLGITAALLGGSNKPILAVFPLVIGFPISMDWLKLQLKIKQESKLDRFPSSKGSSI